MPEEQTISEATDPINQSGDPIPDTEGTYCFEESQSEIKILKNQIVVALSKVKRAAEREDYLLELISRASDDMLCKFRKAPKSLSWSQIFEFFSSSAGAQLDSVTEEERVKARMNALMEISVRIGSDFWMWTRNSLQNSTTQILYRTL